MKWDVVKHTCFVWSQKKAVYFILIAKADFGPRPGFG